MRASLMVAILTLLATAPLVGCSVEEPSAAKAPSSPTGSGSPPAATGAGSGVNATR